MFADELIINQLFHATVPPATSRFCQAFGYIRQYLIVQVVIIGMNVRDDLTCRSHRSDIHGIRDSALDPMNDAMWELDSIDQCECAVSGSPIDEDVLDVWV